MSSLPHLPWRRLVPAATLALVSGAVALGAAPATAAPSNDGLAGAIPLTAGVMVQTNTIGSTVEAAEYGLPAGCGAVATSLWYTFKPATSGRYLVATSGGAANVDSLVDVYTSSASSPTIASLQSVGCDDNSGLGQRSEEVLNAVGGTTYYVRVGDNRLPLDPNSASGPIGVVVSPAAAPAGDDVAGARTVPTRGSVDVDTTFATDGPNEVPKEGDCDPLTQTVWLTWTSATGGVANISIDDGSDEPDTELAAWSGPARAASPGALTSIDCDDDMYGGNRMTSALSFPVTKGTTYYLEVGTADADDAAAFTVQIDAPDPATSTAAKLTLKGPKHARPGHSILVTAKVKTASGVVAEGTVTLRIHGRTLRPRNLKNGVTRFRLPALSGHALKVLATYSGASGVQSATAKLRIRPGTASHHR